MNNPAKMMKLFKKTLKSNSLCDIVVEKVTENRGKFKNYKIIVNLAVDLFCQTY